MLDISFIRDNVETIKQAALDKNVEVDVDRLLELDKERRELQQEIDQLGAKRNVLAQGTKNGKPDQETIEAGRKLKEELSVLEKKFSNIEEEYIVLAEKLPNVPTDDTPVGKDESENIVVSEHGERPEFSFKPKEHWEIAEKMGILDSENAAKLAGSRFVYIKGDLVLLEFALVQFVFNVLTDEKVLSEIIAKAGLSVPNKPFIPVVPPVFTRPEVMQKMARLEPKEERYHVDSDDLYLIGSAEHALGPLHMDQVLDEKDLPKRYIGFSPSFRREAGSYGKDIRGLIRVHQFDKCEMESFSAPDNSLEEHKFFVAIQEYIMESLGLPYRVVLKCTADMGTPNARAIDIETWMPGQNKYRETHTADYMTDYQARRLKTKVKTGKGTDFAHMNDGTACAIGRTLAAIIENNQTEDGTVRIPEVLAPYMGNRSVLSAIK